MENDYYSIKRPRDWLWKVKLTRTDIEEKLLRGDIDQDWLICPFGESEKAISLAAFRKKFPSDTNAELAGDGRNSVVTQTEDSRSKQERDSAKSADLERSSEQAAVPSQEIDKSGTHDVRLRLAPQFRIFISYRRDDTIGVSGRLFDRLIRDVGRGSVFMDVDSMPLGVDFAEHIGDQVSKCSLFLALIGPNWLGDSGGERRIDSSTDFVRIEVEAALQRSIPVIPLLVGETEMPRPEQLPASISKIAFRNGMRLDPGVDFHNHANRLIAHIQAFATTEE